MTRLTIAMAVSLLIAGAAGAQSLPEQAVPMGTDSSTPRTQSTTNPGGFNQKTGTDPSTTNSVDDHSGCAEKPGNTLGRSSTAAGGQPNSQSTHCRQ